MQLNLRPVCLALAVYRLSTFMMCVWKYKRCAAGPPDGRSSRMRFTCSHVDGSVSEHSFGTGSPKHCNVENVQDASYPAGDSTYIYNLQSLSVPISNEVSKELGDFR